MSVRSFQSRRGAVPLAWLGGITEAEAPLSTSSHQPLPTRTSRTQVIMDALTDEIESVLFIAREVMGKSYTILRGQREWPKLMIFQFIRSHLDHRPQVTKRQIGMWSLLYGKED